LKNIIDNQNDDFVILGTIYALLISENINYQLLFKQIYFWEGLFYD